MGFCALSWSESSWRSIRWNILCQYSYQKWASTLTSLRRDRRWQESAEFLGVNIVILSLWFSRWLKRWGSETTGQEVWISLLELMTFRAVLDRWCRTFKQIKTIFRMIKLLQQLEFRGAVRSKIQGKIQWIQKASNRRTLAKKGNLMTSLNPVARRTNSRIWHLWGIYLILECLEDNSLRRILSGSQDSMMILGRTKIKMMTTIKTKKTTWANTPTLKNILTS